MTVSRLVRRGCSLFLLLGVSFFSLARAEEIKYDKGERRDPFVPLVGPHAAKKIAVMDQRLPIEGIIFDPQTGSYVLIGGQVFQEGDAIEGAKLVRILPDRIILLQESKEVVIWLREEILEEKGGPKKPPGGPKKDSIVQKPASR